MTATLPPVPDLSSAPPVDCAKYMAIVGAIADNPDLVARLLDEHALRTDRCNYRHPVAEPCAVLQLARLARAEQHHRALEEAAAAIPRQRSLRSVAIVAV